MLVTYSYFKKSRKKTLFRTYKYKPRIYKWMKNMWNDFGQTFNTIDIDHVGQEQHPTYRSDCIFIFNLRHLFGSYTYFTILTPKGLTNPICVDRWLHMMGPYMTGLQSHSSWNLDRFSLGVLFIRDNLGRGWRCCKISYDINKMWQHMKIVALGVAEMCERPRSSYLGGDPEYI